MHAFKLYNNKGEYQYVKFNFRSQQGVKGLNLEQTAEMQAKNFNHLTNDLYKNINAGHYPKWDFYIQVIDSKDLSKFDFNPLDATKNWPMNLVPEVKVGTLTLNRMPKNFFNETEQSELALGNIVPGIEPSEDRLLQGHVFSYSDTQIYRSYSAQEKNDLIRNLAGDLGQVNDSETKHIMLSYFYKADADYGARLIAEVKGDLVVVKAKAIKLKD